MRPARTACRKTWVKDQLGGHPQRLVEEDGGVAAVPGEFGAQAQPGGEEATTAATPLGLACEEFKSAYRMMLKRAVPQSSVPQVCHEKTTPVEFTP